MPAVWPFRHLGLKVVSVVIAVLVWFMVASEESVERGLRVPLEFQGFPAGLEIEGEPPTLVDVRVRGASSHVAQMTAGDVVAVLDLSAAGPGQRLFTMTPEQVRVPFGVEVVQVQPATIAMVFDRSESRELRVRAVWEGDPAPGFVVGRVTVDPAAVEVVGPAGALERTSEALTETISVAGIHETITKSVPVGFLDPALRLKTPRRASVMIEVLPAPRERRIDARPVHLRDLAPALVAQATPSSVDVEIRGTQDSIVKILPDSLRAYVDLKGLGVGEYQLTVHVDPLPTVGVSAIDPQTLKVSIASARD